MVPLVRARKARYFPVLVCYNVLRPVLLLPATVHPSRTDGEQHKQAAPTRTRSLQAELQ